MSIRRGITHNLGVSRCSHGAVTNAPSSTTQSPVIFMKKIVHDPMADIDDARPVEPWDGPCIEVLASNKVEVRVIVLSIARAVAASERCASDRGTTGC